MKSCVLKPLYARKGGSTLHVVGWSGGTAHSRTVCGLKITPDWKVMNLVQTQGLNLLECKRCKGNSYESFAEYEKIRNHYHSQYYSVIEFNDLSDEQKALIFPALFDSAFHQKEDEAVRLVFQERARYLEERKTEKAHRARLVPSLASSDEGYVYLFHKLKTSLYKIGFSVNPMQRLFSVRSEVSCASVELIHAFPTNNMRRDERKLHKVFSHYRKYGEWFELPSEAVELIKLIKGGLTNG